MSNRHLSRSLALQTLFEFDMRDDFSLEGKEIEKVVEKNSVEFTPGLGDISFSLAIVRGVLQKRVTLDEVLTKAAPDWPIEKIPNVDRNILRIGLFELLFQDHTQVPPKVAIDEAIELGKTFGGESTARFINGVLGRVYKEMGEPGKEQVSKNKGAEKKPIDQSTLHVEELVGAVVYTEIEGQIQLALVHDIFGHWTLSKGHIKEGLTTEEGAIYKIKEELGIDITIVETLGENTYIASHPEFKKVKKHVHYFLAHAMNNELHFEPSSGLSDAKWFSLPEIETLKIYDDILPLLTKGIQIIINRTH